MIFRKEVLVINCLKRISAFYWESDSQDESYNVNVLDENTIISVCQHISDMLSNSSLVEISAPNIELLSRIKVIIMISKNHQ